MSPSTFILPAQSLHTHSASFIPSTPGQLKINGCVIKFSACKLTEFSVLGERSRREKEIWYDMNGGEIKVRQVGYVASKSDLAKDSLGSTTKVSRKGFWLQRVVEAVVLPPQPVLVLDGTSLQDSCLMLLEGES